MALDQNLQGEVAATAKADKSAGFVRRVLGAFGGPTIGLIVMCIALTFISEYFFTADNHTEHIAANGQAFVDITGECFGKLAGLRVLQKIGKGFVKY